MVVIDACLQLHENILWTCLRWKFHGVPVTPTESVGAGHGGKLGVGSPVASAEIRYLHSRQEFFEKNWTNP